MDNTVGAVDVPLQIFGGLDTELAPSDLPEGTSPDNQNVVFLPGSVSTRPGWHGIFNSPFSTYPYYAETYNQPDGNPLTIIASGNNLYKEDVNTLPNQYQQIGTLSQTAGSGAAGATSQGVFANAFGRHYMAFSNGIYGTEIPYQYDGANLDRVSQNGPGAGPSAQDYILSYNIVAAPNGILQLSVPTVSAATQIGYTVTLTLGTALPSQLQVGDFVFVVGVGVSGYNGTWQVTRIISSTQIQYIAANSGLAASSGGNCSTALYQVVTTTANTFAAGNLVTISGAGAHNGTFKIRTIDSTTSFTVDTISDFTGSSGNGTVSAAGNVSAGTHQVVVMFKTRQGYITAPSPPVSWSSSGSLSVQISGIPIGPPNVVARILAFTGAGGDNFFYIPATVTVGGTTTNSTVINDNTTTSAVIDFSDNSLFAATAIDIPGNNLFALQTLTPSLGVFYYASRLFWWGTWNVVTNLLNMGFEGGYSGAFKPLGWNITGSALLTTTALWGWALQINQNGQATQPAHQDWTGTAILQPLTQYSFRFYCVTSGDSASVLTVDLHSATSGTLASCTFKKADSTLLSEEWNTGTFNVATPSVIPSDTVLRLTVTGDGSSSAVVDECMLVYADQPYVNTEMLGSYVINPESFDGVTGYIGPSSDDTPIRSLFNQRNNLYIITGRGLHQTQDQSSVEPSGWTVNELNQATGGVSARCSSGGEDWQMIATPSGLRIFEGSEPYKISQEIQTLWETLASANIQDIWVKNDPSTRRCYVGGTSGVIPNLSLLVLDYRELDTATQISGSAPIRVSFSGRMLSAELGRKWTKWTSMYSPHGSIIARPNGQSEFVICSLTGGNNLFYLDPNYQSDFDTTKIQSYYTTYFFVNHDAEQQLGVGTHRKLYQYLTAFLSGVGNVEFQTLSDSLSNVFETTPQYQMGTSPTFDYEWGLNTLGERVALKLVPSPITDAGNPAYTNGADCSFTLNKLIVSMKQDPYMPVRGVI